MKITNVLSSSILRYFHSHEEFFSYLFPPSTSMVLLESTDTLLTFLINVLYNISSFFQLSVNNSFSFNTLLFWFSFCFLNQYFFVNFCAHYGLLGVSSFAYLSPVYVPFFENIIYLHSYSYIHYVNEFKIVVLTLVPHFCYKIWSSTFCWKSNLFDMIHCTQKHIKVNLTWNNIKWNKNIIYSKVPEFRLQFYHLLTVTLL